MTRIVAAAAALLAAAAAAAQPPPASSWNLVLNGRAVHLDAATDWNEANWGLGLEKEFDTDRRWVKVALANGFKDSLGEPSYMAGGGVKRRFRPGSNGIYVDVGVVGFLMTREEVDDHRPFPGVLPALTLGWRHVALNLTYLPQHAVDELTHPSRRDPSMNGIVFLQLKLNAGLFSFGRR